MLPTSCRIVRCTTNNYCSLIRTLFPKVQRSCKALFPEQDLCASPQDNIILQALTRCHQLAMLQDTEGKLSEHKLQRLVLGWPG